jgi:hypothetical protein
MGQCRACAAFVVEKLYKFCKGFSLGCAVLSLGIQEKSVKPADTPDSVQLGCPSCDRHSSGPRVAPGLGATYPPAQRNHLTTGLLGIAARRDCPFHPRQVALP